MFRCAPARTLVGPSVKNLRPVRRQVARHWQSRQRLPLPPRGGNAEIVFTSDRENTPTHPMGFVSPPQTPVGWPASRIKYVSPLTGPETQAAATAASSAANVLAGPKTRWHCGGQRLSPGRARAATSTADWNRIGDGTNAVASHMSRGRSSTETAPAMICSASARNSECVAGAASMASSNSCRRLGLAAGKSRRNSAPAPPGKRLAPPRSIAHASRRPFDRWCQAGPRDSGIGIAHEIRTLLQGCSFPGMLHPAKTRPAVARRRLRR